MENKSTHTDLLPTDLRQWLVYACLLMIFIGFSCSRVLISLGEVGLLILGLANTDFLKTLQSYITRPAFYISALFFVVILFSGINSDNHSLWLNYLRIKIAFPILPLAFCSFLFFDRSFFNKVLFAFSIVMFVSVLFVMVNYLLHFDSINQNILSGGSIPVPYSHIRYTLLLVFAFFCFIWLWEQQLIKGFALLIPALLIFVSIHVLSSRSGWAALYLGLLFYFLVFIFHSRNYILGSIFVVGLCTLPFVLYQLLPSFQNKVKFMQYNIAMYEQGHIDDLSDAMRISSWHTGVEIIREHPFSGVGVGDLRQQSIAVSKRLYPNIVSYEDRKMPHCEFLWIFAGAGIGGFAGYCLAFFFPFLSNIRRHNWLFAILFLIFFTSFFTEYPLEEQIGSTFYLLFLLIFLAHFNTLDSLHE